MEKKFPVINVVKAALAAPFSHVSGLLWSFGLMAGAMLAVYFYASVNGLTWDIISSFSDPSKVETVSQYAGTVFKVLLLLLVLVGGVSAFLFNFWVRYGAFGAEKASFPTVRAAISATLVNMVKFAFIFLVMGVVGYVVMFILNVFGLAGDTVAQNDALAAGDLQTLTASGFLSSFVNLIVVCFVYSFFSANLTQTALASEKEGFEHPYTLDFAIVIFLVYLVLFIPGTLAGLTGNWALSIGLQLVLGTYVAFSIAVAHGLRYQICIAARADEQAPTGE